MLPQVLPHHPPHLQIPKSISDYPSHILSRPKLTTSLPYFVDFTHCVSSSVSPVQPDSPATVEDEIHSPQSPLSGSGNYYYVSRDSGSFVDSPISPVEMYENNSQQSASYPTTTHPYQSAPAPPDYDIINSGNTIRITQSTRPYVSESPSPVDAHPSTSYTQLIDVARTQERLPHIMSTSYQTEGDNFDALSDPMSSRYSRSIVANRYPSGDDMHSSNALDHRRMSEPAILGPTNPYASQSGDNEQESEPQFNYNPPAINPLRASASAYVPSLQRGASMSSLRDPRQMHLEYLPPSQPTYPDWKGDAHLQPPQPQDYQGGDVLDEPISPLRRDFSGGIDSSLQYSPSAKNYYGPSPPGTGTSTSSAPVMSPTALSFLSPTGGSGVDQSPKDANSKTYSFVALPGNAVKKRPRRRYDEIERLYRCSWPDCNKAYGTLNHLNAHVTMQKHGVKRNPSEFKELRKQWRKAKKEAESQSPTLGPLRRASLSVQHDSHELHTSHYMGIHHHSDPTVYARRASYHSGNNLPSAATSTMAGSADRYGYPNELSRYPDEDRENHLATYSTYARQRYSGASPASWHAGPSRAGMHQYVSSLPSETNPQYHHVSDIADTDSQLHHPQAQPYQYPRPQTPPAGTMNRLPPDSMLLTPIQGYHPPPLLPPLQVTDNVHYPSDGYDVYERDSSGRPGTGHGSDEY